MFIPSKICADNNRFPLGLYLDYGIKGSYWFTSDDDDGSEYTGHALDYQPEFIPVQFFQGEVRWKGETWFHHKYETAFSNDKVKQEMMLEVSKTPSAINRINTFLSLFPLLGSSKNTLINIVSVLRVDYKHHKFFGKAEVQEQTLYIGNDDNRINLEPGDEIRFQSDFKEYSLNYRIKRNSFFGFYYNKTQKPHEASIQGNEVYETDITGIGLKILLDHRTIKLDANLGVVRFLADDNKFRSNGFETLIHFEWLPHIYIFGSSETRHNFLMIPLIGSQFSMQLGSTPEGFESDGTGEISMDIIVDVGIRVQYQF